MASTDAPEPIKTTEMPEESHIGDVDVAKEVIDSTNATQKPVEMTDLSSSKTTNIPTPAVQTEEQAVSTTMSTASQDANVISPAPQIDGPSTARISADESAIGPATERPLANIQSNPAAGPQLVITLLLHSTDTRHPYILTQKYLKKRNIQVTNDDPINLTVYNLKDLIWRDWRDDWEIRPASPTSIRLIHMGRMLEDKAYLKDSRFATGDTPHVVHMSIKPQEAIDDEDARMAKGSTRDRADSERGSRCRCVVM